MTASKIVAAAASGVGGAGLDVDEVFSTYLYEATGDTSYNAGNGSDNTINNGIDLSGEGGLVWIKSREHSNPAGNYETGSFLYDTVRGAGKYIRPNKTGSQLTASDSLKSFNSNGFTLGKDSDSQGVNYQQRISGEDHVSWTFRKAPKFFDVVTYTGTGSHPRNVSHNLGSAPGMILVKNLGDGTEDWIVYHRGVDSSEPEDYGLFLNLTDSRVNNDSYWGDTAPTSTTFTVGGNITNQSGENFVAYLFAHNDGDGGFGPDGDQDVISCGSYTEVNGADVKVDLGFEPQWIMIKVSDTTGGWGIYDVMRGWTSGSDDFALNANTSSAESNVGDRWLIHPDGFTWKNTGNTRNIIYMAIRRGPLAVPDDATKVFSMDTQGSSAPYFDSNHIVDMSLVKALTTTGDWYLYTRLLGEKSLATNHAGGEANASEAGFDFMDGHIDANWGSGFPRSAMWKRAPGYFDVVTYTGTGSIRTVAHNLGVAPEMMWIKCRSAATNWGVYYGDNTDYMILSDTGATQDNVNFWNDTSPTSSVFTLGSENDINKVDRTYIAYLFTSAPGVSKVGNFSLSGSDIDVDCGFSNGARWVMIKRTDGTGNWFQFDTIRGITSGTDSTIYLNTTDDEETADYIDPLSSGFSLVGSAWPSGDYIFYAIA